MSKATLIFPLPRVDELVEVSKDRWIELSGYLRRMAEQLESRHTVGVYFSREQSGLGGLALMVRQEYDETYVAPSA